jgi:hypothetical protein
MYSDLVTLTYQGGTISKPVPGLDRTRAAR